MRKARLILTLITVFAIVGGLLAFKVRHYNVFTYYTCNMTWRSCQRTWAIAGFQTTIYDPDANVTVSYAATNPQISGVDCADACTYSNKVYFEPGF
jgi:hypothetical protein